MVSTATGLKQPTGSRRFSRLFLSLGACFREERCLFPGLTRTLQPSLRTNQGGDFGSGAAAAPLIRSASPEGRDGEGKDGRDGEKFLIPQQKTPVIIII